MTSNGFSWKTNEALPAGKGATLQEFSTKVGPNNLEISVAPWGEGRLKVNGREIVHINDAKDRRQAFRILENIADIYLKEQPSKTDGKKQLSMIPPVKADRKSCASRN